MIISRMKGVNLILMVKEGNFRFINVTEKNWIYTRSAQELIKITLKLLKVK